MDNAYPNSTYCAVCVKAKLLDLIYRPLNECDAVVSSALSARRDIACGFMKPGGNLYANITR